MKDSKEEDVDIQGEKKRKKKVRYLTTLIMEKTNIVVEKGKEGSQ